MLSLTQRWRWFLAATLSGAATLTGQGAVPPNVIVIVSDDQGWADIGYHNPKVYSPRLDALAAAGVKFSQHYVMPQCTPTRVALMTGRYPSRFGPVAQQANNAPAFPLGTPTLASMFAAKGYETYLCGKWHLGSEGSWPTDHGFDINKGGWDVGGRPDAATPAAEAVTEQQSERKPSHDWNSYSTPSYASKCTSLVSLA
mgnify:CR=1 FL=1